MNIHGGERGREGSEETRQQDRRLKADQNNQHPPHEKCPRCESSNTKFCYFNNYSLSQPRYYCKTCRRYWTQGGTLRNVPVGGGVRKGKRAKTSSGDGASRSQAPAAKQVQLNLTNPPPIMGSSSSLVMTTSSLGPRSGLEPGGFASNYYPGTGASGYLSSLFNQVQNFDQLGSGSSSSLNLLQGFNFASLNQRLQQERQIPQPLQFYPAGDGDKNNVEAQIYPSGETLFNNQTRPASASHHDWPESFLNSSAQAASGSTFWTIGGGNSGGNTTRADPSLNPNQWPDHSGYTAPPGSS
ncbi:hypothetical protein UlMin_018415 [Ulmus minor]